MRCQSMYPHPLYSEYMCVARMAMLKIVRMYTMLCEKLAAKVFVLLSRLTLTSHRSQKRIYIHIYTIQSMVYKRKSTLPKHNPHREPQIEYETRKKSYYHQPRSTRNTLNFSFIGCSHVKRKFLEQGCGIRMGEGL